MNEAYFNAKGRRNGTWRTLTKNMKIIKLMRNSIKSASGQKHFKRRGANFAANGSLKVTAVQSL